MDLWYGVDPLTERHPDYNPFAYTASNPIRFIDPDGRDWYEDEKTGYYHWFKGSDCKDGYKHIGAEGSLLGEFEGNVNDLMKNTYDFKDGLYTEGVSYDITNNNKGAILPSDGNGGGNFLDEFINGTGPDVSFLMSDHPYTETMKRDGPVRRAHSAIENQKTDVPDQMTNVKSGFGLKGYLSPYNRTKAEQFIGSYRLDVFSSNDCKSFCNIISDVKSRSSLLYDANANDVKRGDPSTKTWGTGNTYQFYLWKSPRK